MKHLTITAALVAVITASPVAAQNLDASAGSVAQSGAYINQEASDVPNPMGYATVSTGNTTAPCIKALGTGLAQQLLGLGASIPITVETCMVMWEAHQLSELTGDKNVGIIHACNNSEKLAKSLEATGYCAKPEPVQTVAVKAGGAPAILKRCEPMRTILKRRGTAAEEAAAVEYCRGQR